ncbi:hypothetical protein ACFL96_19510, partial [Thermoproteota archaeon]
MVRATKRYLFIVLLLIFGTTFFTRNNLKNVNIISPEVLRQPIQEKIYDPKIIEFTNENCRYQLTPLFDYEISSIIVSKLNYSRFSIYKHESVFPLDLCLIWGSNAESGVYKSSALSFSQDCRWCWVNWHGDIKFNVNEFSNNHLLVNSKELETKINSLVVGDQIKIVGKLVDVKADILDKSKKIPARSVTWKTSLKREDNGAGACEVIYIEDIKILRKANVISRYLF